MMNGILDGRRCRIGVLCLVHEGVKSPVYLYPLERAMEGVSDGTGTTLREGGFGLFDGKPLVSNVTFLDR